MLQAKISSNYDSLQDQTNVLPRTFGTYTKHLRERSRPRISQAALVKKMVELSGGVPFGRSQYSRIESEELYPSIDQVSLIFMALRELQAMISPDERKKYLLYAERKLSEKGTHHDKENTPQKWREIEKDLEAYEKQASFPLSSSSALNSSQKYIHRVQYKFADIRHVVGRDEWINHVVQLLLAPLAAKLFILQGSMGSGKSMALNALGKNLVEHFSSHVLLIELPKPEDDLSQKFLPEEYLDQFLGAVLGGLGFVAGGEKKKSAERAERVEMLFTTLSQNRTIILVDNADLIFDAHGVLASSWELFLNRYLRSQHEATLIFATREWPGWYESSTSSFVEEMLLPQLTVEDGVTILRRLGFDAVSRNVLEQASARVNHHPEALLWLAKLAKKRAYSVSWSQAPIKSGDDLLSFTSQVENHSDGTSKEENALRNILQERQIFRSTAAHTMLQPLLYRVINMRVSHDALQLLELLAVAPLALFTEAAAAVIEPPVLFKQLAELQQVSLLIAREDRLQLQPLVAASGYHLVSVKRRGELESQLIAIYRAWIGTGEFVDEQEQAQVITESALLLLKQEHLLEAAQLLIQYGWLSFGLGFGVTIARQAQDVLRQGHWKSTLENERGGLLLKVYLGRYVGEDLAAEERKQIYLLLYEMISADRTTFKPRVVQHIIHHKLRYLVAEDRYREAVNVIEQECTYYSSLQESDPTTYVELLDLKAYVFGRWGDFLSSESRKKLDQTENVRKESARLRSEAAKFHLHCIELLRRYEQFTSPLEKSYIRIRRARYLNDASYYLRCTGQLEQAKKAMEECLEIKEAGAAVEGSLAVSYDDYGELLGLLGKFQEAEHYSNLAMQIEQHIMQEGNSSVSREMGMLQINRGKLLLLLGRLDEAKELFITGMPLVEGTSRRNKIAEADEGMRIIREWHTNNPLHQLDWRWFPHYQKLSAFSDVKLLSQAGPFTDDEQKEFDTLIRQKGEKAVNGQLSMLVAQSRKRELITCLNEQREPQFHYPFILCDDIPSRIDGLFRLRSEIEQEERNAVVRNLYLRTIDEQLNVLQLIKAAGRRDDAAFQLYNDSLNPKPTNEEMEVAVHQIAIFAQKGLQSNDSYTKELGQKILDQLKQWRLVSKRLKPLDADDQGKKASDFPGQASKSFSAATVERFFTFVFEKYGFDGWHVLCDPAADHPSVSLNLRRLTLSAETSISGSKIRALLGHEIEVHAFRSIAGSKSSLALLSSGLFDYLDTEEGLALTYEQEVAHYSFDIEPEKLWLGTLASGLASGVDCAPLTFRQLLVFFEDITVLRSLLSGRSDSIQKIRETSRDFAIRRCLRTFRGVSRFQQPGLCSTKDANYFRGYKAVSRALEEEPGTFEQLMCGSIGLHHRKDLTELGIFKPAVSHLQLATDPDLEKNILQFVE